MIKLIIFDYDDTLVNSSKELYKADMATLKAIGLKPVSKSKYFSGWGKSHREMIKNLYPKINFNQYLTKYKIVYNPNKIKLSNGSKNILSFLRKKKIKLAILSAKQKEFLDEHLKESGIRNYFSYIHGAESSRFKKPDPRVFNDIINFFRIPHSEILYVGDAVTDFKASSKAGINFIGVITGIDDVKKFRKAECNQVINSLKELKSKLKNII